MSDDMGKTLIQIKQKTLDDEVRICVSDLHDEGDARALEKYYHSRCLRSAQRSLDTAVFTSTSLVRSLCDEELLISVENSLVDENGQLSIADVYDAYLSIMRRYQIEINEGGNYKKYLKHLITERIPNAQFVKSLRKNEPENIVLQSTLSKAVDIWSTLHDTDEKVTYLKHISRLLREELLDHR